MQRLRIKFSRGQEVKYISHLDLMRLWERALRRASVPLLYSQGFSPHPRLSLAAPLPIGVTSEGELMDIYLSRIMSPDFFFKAVRQQLPRGIDFVETQVMAIQLPSLQSSVRSAEYVVEINMERSADDVEQAIFSLLKARRLPWQHKRESQVRSYDLRALIEHLWLKEARSPQFSLGMRLRCDENGSGRPEQVVAALGFPYPTSIHRTRLLLKGIGRPC